MTIDQRGILDSDKELLSKWIEADPYHKGDSVDFWYQEGTVCNVYSDEIGPVFFMRGQPLVEEGTKIVRLDMQFGDCSHHRNLRALVLVNQTFCQQAKTSGFKELLFYSNAPPLKSFCIRRLDFTEPEPGLLRKYL